jgi:predicted RNA methylase
VKKLGTFPHPSRHAQLPVLSPGYTPSVRHVPELVALLANAADDPEDAVATAIERALAKLGDELLPLAEAEWAGAAVRARVHLLRAVGRLPSSEDAVRCLARGLDDEEPRVRRAAARALGKARGSEAKLAEASLLATWKRLKETMAPPEQRAMAEALGKLGAKDALALVEGIATESDELRRVVARSKLRIERGALREEGGRIVPEARSPKPVPIVYRVRRGLEPVLQDELGKKKSTSGNEWVKTTLDGSLLDALVPRTALSFAFPLPSGPIAEVLAGKEALSIFETWTEGPVRYRLSFRGGGHRRGEVFRIAEQVSAKAPRLVNDPTASLWEVVIGDEETPSIELVPRGLEDSRFAYRTRDVPAASHPTIAAALARVAGIRKEDVVWDPFMGSGTELIECHRLGAKALFGTDLDARALDAARANLAKANVTATLSQKNALNYTPPGVTLIVTNPPMGLRVSRTKDLAETLEHFVAHAAAILPPGGRVVWLSPFASRTKVVSIANGFTIELGREVDMGGFSATLEVLRKKKRSRG